VSLARRAISEGGPGTPSSLRGITRNASGVIVPVHRSSRAGPIETEQANQLKGRSLRCTGSPVNHSAIVLTKTRRGFFVSRGRLASDVASRCVSRFGTQLMNPPATTAYPFTGVLGTGASSLTSFETVRVAFSRWIPIVVGRTLSLKGEVRSWTVTTD
jgi:hypothetical protein